MEDRTPENARSRETETIELRIPASSEWVRVARLTVAGVASRLHFGIEEIEDIKLAVAEAINNAIQHAPVPAGSGAAPIVTISFKPGPQGILIEVTDEGRIEDGLPVHEASPVQKDEDLPEGGLGFLLIRTLMDDVSHLSGPHSDTSVRMFKKLPARVARPAAGAERSSLHGGKVNPQDGAAP